MVSFSAAVSACEKGQQWQRALQLFFEARTRQGRPDVILLGASISACEKGRQWQHALSLLKDAQSSNLFPDTTSFNATLSAVGKSFYWEKALELFQGLPAPDVISFDVLLDAAALAKQWSQVLYLLEEMDQKHFERTDFSYMSALTSCIGAEQWQHALVLWETLEADRRPNEQLRLTVLDAFEDASNWQKALELQTDGDVALSLGCIRLLVRTGQFETALQLYGHLEEEGIFQPWISEHPGFNYEMILSGEEREADMHLLDVFIVCIKEIKEKLENE
eukprot:symbB.v1.2.000166.t1/scaffold9.1/size550961/22